MLLVTGANGYLGGWIDADLRADSHLRLLDGRPIADVKHLVTSIVHCGWFSRAGDREPEMQRESLQGTIALCELFRSSGVRFVFASTVSVYAEDAKTVAPACEYTRAKLAGERVVQAYFKERALSVRLASLMGAGSGRTKRDVCVNAFAIDGWQRKQIDVWNPDAWKPILHVRDAADLLRAQAFDKRSGTMDACWASLQAKAIAERVAAITGADVREVADVSGYRSCNMPVAGPARRTLSDAVHELKHVAGEVTDAKQYGPERRRVAAQAAQPA